MKKIILTAFILILFTGCCSIKHQQKYPLTLSGVIENLPDTTCQVELGYYHGQAADGECVLSPNGKFSFGQLYSGKYYILVHWGDCCDSNLIMCADVDMNCCNRFIKLTYNP